MFNWFKKKSAPSREAIAPGLDQFVKPMAIATALTEAISEYFMAVKNGKKSSPAYQRKQGNVIGIWGDTRLEALRQLWGYGASDIALLANHHQQKRLLDSFVEEKPYLEYPLQPSGDSVHDTLQAIFQVYLFLGEAGSAVADKETAGSIVFSGFEQQAKTLQTKWGEFEEALHGSRNVPPTPSTLVEILYEDVTRKAKTIALSSQFGANYRAGLNCFVELYQREMKSLGHSEDRVKKEGDDLQMIIQKILAAESPDSLPEEIRI